MTKTLRDIVKAGTLALAFFCGCERQEVPRSDRATIIRYDDSTRKTIIEKFTDVDRDGNTDFYVIGPRSPEERTMPDPASTETRAFASRKQADLFYAKHGKDAVMGVTYNSEPPGYSVILGGIKAEIMEPDMQSKVNAKYAALNSDLKTK